MAFLLYVLVIAAALCTVLFLLARLSKEGRSAPSDPGSGERWTPRSANPARRHRHSHVTLLSPAPVAIPVIDAETRRSLEALSWQEFELVVGELYRRRGCTVQMCAGDGADGGVDLRLEKDGETMLVQCKHWKVYRVGPAPVRELFGILAAGSAQRAIFLTTGQFTRDALAFAQGKPLELIDGVQLKRLVAQHEQDEAGSLLDVGSWRAAFARTATITTPTCPFCHTTMVLRTARQSHNQFWGCRSYPRCRGKRNARSELLPANSR